MNKFEVVCIDDSTIKGVQIGEHYMIEKHQAADSYYHYKLYSMKGNKIKTLYANSSYNCFISISTYRHQQLNKLLNE